MSPNRCFRLAFSLLALALAFAAACGTSTRLVATNPPPRAMRPRPPESVEVYLGSLPTRSFVEVGVLQDVPKGIFLGRTLDYTARQMPAIIQSMRARAARFGCDAVVLNTESKSTRDAFWGACLVYPDIGAAATRAAQLRAPRR